MQKKKIKSMKKSQAVMALFFEDIAVSGNGANHVPIKPLLRKTSPKTCFFYFFLY